MTRSLSTWFPPPKPLKLGSDEVHVWRALLDQPVSRRQDLEHFLSVDERNRAERFHFQKDRYHYVVAHALLRIILGRYLGLDPEQLRFCYGPYGKPTLAAATGGNEFHFNMSHSHEIVLYAVTRGREIGIDVERINLTSVREQVAERFFSPQEVAALRLLPIDLQPEAFFNCWTRKEAYVKAKGDGLSLALDQFDVSLMPGEPAALLSTKDNPIEASRWSLQELSPGFNYVAALAVEGHDWRLKCWQWLE